MDYSFCLFVRGEEYFHIHSKTNTAKSQIIRGSKFQYKKHGSCIKSVQAEYLVLSKSQKLNANYTN